MLLVLFLEVLFIKQTCTQTFCGQQLFYFSKPRNKMSFNLKPCGEKCAAALSKYEFQCVGYVFQGHYLTSSYTQLLIHLIQRLSIIDSFCESIFALMWNC